MNRIVPGPVGLAIILILVVPAYASPGTGTISGRGTGNVLCMPPMLLVPATLSFSASTTGATISGSYTITAPSFSGPVVVISGTINGGKIGSQSYDVTGVEIMNGCNPPPFTGAGPISIEGRCGSGVIMSYEVTEHPSVSTGSFLGTATCT